MRIEFETPQDLHRFPIRAREMNPESYVIPADLVGEIVLKLLDSPHVQQAEWLTLAGRLRESNEFIWKKSN